MKDHNRSVTMQDIAREVGVSRPTVSLALRDHPCISLRRRRQVKDAAVRMGYRPNAMATALAHRKWTITKKRSDAVIAWINVWPQPKELRRHHEFDGYWHGAAQAAEKFGYRLEEFSVNEELTLRRIDKILWSRNIDGILIPPLPSEGGTPRWADFQWDRFSVARFGHSMSEPRVDLVTADQVGAARLAYFKIREKGYRRIGFVTSRSSAERLLFKAGFLVAQSEFEKKGGIPPLILNPGESAQMQERFAEWLERHQPDAIFAEMPGVRGMLEQAGRRVPKDIGLAACSVLDGNADAGIFQNSEEIGRAAVLLVISLIHDGARGIPKISRQVLIAGTWMDGSTLPPCRAPAYPAARRHAAGVSAGSKTPG